MADADSARRRFRLLRNRDLKHAVLAGRADALGIGTVGQCEAAVEGAIRTLDARQLAVLLLRLRLALAANRQDALVHADIDVLRVDARNVGEDDEALVLLLDVDARRPLAGHD